MNLKKYAKIILGVMMTTALFSGCGEQKVNTVEETNQMDVAKDDYMNMKKGNRAEFVSKDKEGKESKVKIKMVKAERTSDRNIGQDHKDVIIFTYEYEVVEAKSPVTITTAYFVVKNQDGEKLNLYSGYQDHFAKETNVGEKCRAQMVFSSEEEMIEGITVEFVNPGEREKPLGIWDMEIQKRDYITG